MPEQDDDIEKEAEEVLKELSKALGEIDLEETYYVVEDINVTRKKNAIKLDRDGNFIMEVGKWVE